jgi:hypothetical protein
MAPVVSSLLLLLRLLLLLLLAYTLCMEQQANKQTNTGQHNEKVRLLTQHVDTPLL